MEDKIDKLVFLDIDGVMTSVADGTSYLCMDPSCYSLSCTATSNLFRILDSTNACVVIHSTWVKWRGDVDHKWGFPIPGTNRRIWFESLLFDLISVLSDDNRYLDCVRHESGRNKRGDIEEWLETHRGILADNCRILILDDDPTMERDQVSFGNSDVMFLNCNPLTGLTKGDSDKAIEFLGIHG